MINTILATIFSMTVATATLVTPVLEQPHQLATRQISLNNRYPVPSVSEIFKDNILLNLTYLRAEEMNLFPTDWAEVRKPFEYKFELNPGETFAYHDDILPQYQGKVVRTTNAHFNGAEGFKSSGYLFGDGVCHLASLIYWVALEAGLDAVAPTNHNFMAIPEIDKKYGVSIYANPFIKGSDARQNLYVTNNKNYPVVFKFEYNGADLKLSIAEVH